MVHRFSRLSDHKTSNDRGLRYVFIIIDNFSKYLWCVL